MKHASLFVLALALVFVAGPVFAADAPAADAPPSLELDRNANLTPVPEPSDALSVEELLRQPRIQLCRFDEPLCPPGCICLIINEQPGCYC